MKIRCSGCKLKKDTSFFSKNKNTKSGYRYKCKSCERKYWDEYKIKNCEKVNLKNKKYRLENPEKMKENSKRSIERIREGTRRSKIMVKDLGDNQIRKALSAIRINDIKSYKIDGEYRIPIRIFKSHLLKELRNR